MTQSTGRDSLLGKATSSSVGITDEWECVKSGEALDNRNMHKGKKFNDGQSCMFCNLDLWLETRNGEMVNEHH